MERCQGFASLPSVLPCIFFNQVITSQSSFLSIKRNIQPFSIPTAITCKNNEQEQHRTCGAAWPTGRKDPFSWATLAAQGVLWVWLYAHGYSTSSSPCQGHGYSCLWGSVYWLWDMPAQNPATGTMLEQVFLTCALLEEEINHKDAHWVQRSFRLSSCLLPHCQLWEESSCY